MYDDTDEGLEAYDKNWEKAFSIASDLRKDGYSGLYIRKELTKGFSDLTKEDITDIIAISNQDKNIVAGKFDEKTHFVYKRIYESSSELDALWDSLWDDQDYVDEMLDKELQDETYVIFEDNDDIHKGWIIGSGTTGQSYNDPGSFGYDVYGEDGKEYGVDEDTPIIPLKDQIPPPSGYYKYIKDLINSEKMADDYADIGDEYRR
jgi:hypothetical protein